MAEIIPILLSERRTDLTKEYVEGVLMMNYDITGREKDRFNMGILFYKLCPFSALQNLIRL